MDNDDDSSHLVDEMNKSEGNVPPPVVAATFTHSILIESMSLLDVQFSNFSCLILVPVDIVKEPVLTGECNDDEKQLLTKSEKDEQYGSGYLPGLSWVIATCVIINFLPNSALILMQPKRAHWILKIIWFVQWPFSLLRWLTVPSFGHVSSDTDMCHKCAYEYYSWVLGWTLEQDTLFLYSIFSFANITVDAASSQRVERIYDICWSNAFASNAGYYWCVSQS